MGQDFAAHWSTEAMIDDPRVNGTRRSRHVGALFIQTSHTRLMIWPTCYQAHGSNDLSPSYSGGRRPNLRLHELL